MISISESLNTVEIIGMQYYQNLSCEMEGEDFLKKNMCKKIKNLFKQFLITKNI